MIRSALGRGYLSVAIAVGAMIAGGIGAVRGSADPTPAISPVPALEALTALRAQGLARDVSFSPLLAYSVTSQSPSTPSSKNQRRADPADALQLCAVLDGVVPFAVFALGNEYLTASSGSVLGGYRISAIRDGAVELADGTTLVVAPCGGAPVSSPSISTSLSPSDLQQQPALAPITGAPSPTPGADLVPWGTPSGPQLYGQPVQSPSPYLLPNTTTPQHPVYTPPTTQTAPVYPPINGGR